jgi:hypothetical protein
MSQELMLALGVQNTGAAGNINTPDFLRNNTHVIHAITNITAAPGVVTVTPVIQGKDVLGNYYDILVGPALVTAGLNRLAVGSGLNAVANVSIGDSIPDIWRVQLRHSGAGAFTYSVTANGIV